MPYLLLPVLALTLLALGLAALLNVCAHRAFPLAACAVTGVLYVFSLFGLLRAGLFAVYALAAGAGVLLAVRAYNRRLPQGTGGALLLWALFLGVSIYENLGNAFIGWDEFSHWGLAVKSMTLLDALHTSPASIATFKDYPPAATLFEYFFTRSAPAFREDAALIAVNLLFFSLVMPAFALTRGRGRAGQGLLLTLIVFLLPTVFYPDFYRQIYVDALLGLLMGAALLTYFADASLCGRLTTAGLLGMLTLTKSSGAGLAALALLVMAADAALFQRARRRQVVCTALLVLACALSWKAHLALAGVGDSWSAGSLSLSLSEAQRDIVLVFLRSLAEFRLAEYWIPLTAAMGLALFFAAGWRLCSGGETLARARGYTAYALLGAGAGVYALTLLALYLFAYSPYEAQNLASFGRYLSTYALAMLAVAAGHAALGGFRAGTAKGAVAALLAICALSDVGTTAYGAATAPIGSRGNAAWRQRYTAARTVLPLLGEEERLYILSPVAGDADWWITRYELMLPDASLNPSNTTSVGASPYHEDDTWTHVVDPDAWAQEVAEEYAYVYLCYYLDAFERDFGRFFPQGVREHTLYRVAEADGTLALLPVEA